MKTQAEKLLDGELTTTDRILLKLLKTATLPDAAFDAEYPRPCRQEMLDALNSYLESASRRTGVAA